jgi:hypothetical protein
VFSLSRQSSRVTFVRRRALEPKARFFILEYDKRMNKLDASELERLFSAVVPIDVDFSRVKEDTTLSLQCGVMLIVGYAPPAKRLLNCVR